MAPAVALGHFYEPFDLGLRKVLAVLRSALGRRLGVTVRITMDGVTNFRCDFAMI
jgi:hypothetical protein